MEYLQYVPCSYEDQILKLTNTEFRVQGDHSENPEVQSLPTRAEDHPGFVYPGEGSHGRIVGRDRPFGTLAGPLAKEIKCSALALVTSALFIILC